MNESKKKPNMLLALLLSLLTSLAGGAVFGLIYGIGYYIYFLAAAEIALAVGVFVNFMKNANGKTITLAIIWCVIWTFIFNILSVVICEAIFVSKEFGISFIESYRVIMELWKTDSEIKSYMNTRVFQIAAMIILGGIVYGVYAIINRKRAQKNMQYVDNAASNAQIPSDQNTINQTDSKLTHKPNSTKNPSNISNQILTKAKEIYIVAFNDCKVALENYQEDQNHDKLKVATNAIKDKHFREMDENVREYVIIIINKFLAKDTLLDIDKNTNETLLKLINK